MTDLEKLEQQVRAKLAHVAACHQTERAKSACLAEEREHHQEAYHNAARQLMESVIRPRIEKVVSCFPNVLPAETTTPSQWCCRFRKTLEFPLSTKLSFVVSPDAQLENLIVTFDLEILPVYFRFQGHDQFVVPIERVLDASVADWLDAKLLGFVDTYLRMDPSVQNQTTAEAAAAGPPTSDSACISANRAILVTELPNDTFRIP